jgi:2-phosphoglycolate phosphatase
VIGATAAGSVRAVLFDHDGTLVDSLPVVVEATNAVLAAHGRPALAPAAVVAGMILPTGPRMAAAGGFPADRERPLAEAYYAAAIRLVDRARAYDGCADLLDALAGRGLALGVVSNNESRFVHVAMHATGLDRRIALRLGEADIPAPKPHPGGLLVAAERLGVAPAACVYVGDSPVDAQAAAGAGMRAIGVTWGTHRRDELASHGFAALIDRPADLLGML